MNDSFKYDVAFSFLQEDEQLALEIADRIRDRVNVFIYSEQQNELAGQDGVDKFSRVFGQEARVVVILHRESWGQTKWTRIEDNAIKTRFLNNGPGFLLIIPLDSPDKLPPWVPLTHIWLGIDRYGVNGVSSVIESRVQSAGGIVRVDSPVNYALRVHRALQDTTNKLRWYKSREGVIAAQKAAENLCELTKNQAEEIGSNSLALYTDSSPHKKASCLVIGEGYTLAFTWEPKDTDSLTNSLLYVQLFEGYISDNQDSDEPGPKELQKKRFEPDIDSSGTVVWREKGEKHTVTSSQLTNAWLKELIKNIHARREKEIDAARYI